MPVYSSRCFWIMSMNTYLINSDMITIIWFYKRYHIYHTKKWVIGSCTWIYRFSLNIIFKTYQYIINFSVNPWKYVNEHIIYIFFLSSFVTWKYLKMFFVLIQFCYKCTCTFLPKGGGGGAVLVFFFKFCVFFFLKGGGSKTEIMEEIWERDWQACRMNQ